MRVRISVVFVTLVTLTAMHAAPAFADSDLAKKSQNPIGNMISLPMQNNTYFGVGPSEEWANSFQFQPVYPVNFGKQPVDIKVRPFWYAEKPENDPERSLQIQAKLLFPK